MISATSPQATADWPLRDASDPIRTAIISQTSMGTGGSQLACAPWGMRKLPPETTPRSCQLLVGAAREVAHNERAPSADGGRSDPIINHIRAHAILSRVCGDRRAAAVTPDYPQGQLRPRGTA